MNSHQPENYDCLFCKLSSGVDTGLDSQQDIVWNDGKVIAFISPKWWPKNPGHVIVIPVHHFENLFDVDEEVLAQVNSVAKKVAIAMKETYQCDGISTRQHNEPAGNQEIWHFHMHVFPRWNGDDLYTNYKNGEFVKLEDRLPYAKKLIDYFANISV